MLKKHKQRRRVTISRSDVDKLLTQYSNLVVSIARSFNMPYGMLDEMIQNGRIGLWKAILKYEPSKGELSTFARQSIVWHIIKGLKNEKKSITLKDEIGYDSPLGLWEIECDSLTELEQELLSLRWEGYTIAEIGNRYNKSREWAGKMLLRIYKKLKEANET